MKILVFSPYHPPHVGGLESHADEFNKYLSQKRIGIVVFTPRLPKDAPENEIRHDDVKIIRFPAFEIIHNYPLPKFWTIKFWWLFLNLFKQNFDIVISRTRFFNTSLLALIYAKITKTRWVHIEHGSDFVKLNSSIKSNIAKLYDYTFGKIILLSADKVVANSEASAKFCEKIVPGIICEIIYRGVEIDKIASIQPNLRIKNEYPDSLIITFIGRLIDGKGVIDLITAIKDTTGDFKLFIIGDGPQKENLEKLSKELRLEKKIVFFGHLKFSDVIGILKISDIFVNPSYTEGLPTSVIEAAFCKKAIIATDVGGTPEIITNHRSGFLIIPKDTNTLKNKIELLISNEDLRKSLGNHAIEDVKNKFDWDSSIKKYLRIFLNLKEQKK